MAARNTIGAKIVLEGAQEYNNQIKNINSSNKALESQSKLLDAQFKTSANSIQALSAKHENLASKLDNQKSKIKTYSDALASSENNLRKCGDNVQNWKNKLADAESKLAEMKNSTSSSTEEIKKQEEAVEKAKNGLKTASNQYDQCQRSTNNWEAKLNDAQVKLYDLDGELQKNDKYLEEAQQSSDGCAKSIDSFGKEMKNVDDDVAKSGESLDDCADSMDEYGDSAEDAGKDTLTFGDIVKANIVSDMIVSGLKTAANAIKDFGKAAIETGADFQASMSDVAATMGMTADQVNSNCEDYQKLSAAAKECGETTKFTASEAAEALNYEALAGYDASKAVETLPTILNLAAAGGMDLASASDMVTDSMSALSLDTSQAADFVDKLAVTAQKSNTSVAQLGEGILTVGGTANSLSGGVTELATCLGILADNGIKSAEGGTHLRNIILSLASPTDKATQAITELGLQTHDSEGNLRSLNDIFGDLNTAMDGMTQQQKDGFITKIFNKTDLSSVNALLKGTGDRFNELSGYIDNSKGAAQNMADTLNNNLKGDVTILGSAMDGLKISIFDCFQETLRKGVQSATAEISSLSASISGGELQSTFEKLGEAIGDLANAAINLATAVLPKLIDAFVWVVDHGNEIVSILIGIGTAMALNKGIDIVIAIVEVYKKLKIAIEEASSAQAIANAVMAATPTGAILTGVAALAAGVAAYCTALDNASTASQEMIDACNEITKANSDLSSSMEATAKKAEQAGSYKTQAEEAHKMVDELYKLDSASNKTNETRAKEETIIQRLNALYPELGLSIDENTGKLNMQKQSVDNLIETYKKQAEAEAYKSVYAEQLQEKIKAEETYKKAKEELLKACDGENEVVELAMENYKGYQNQQGQLIYQGRENAKQHEYMKEMFGGEAGVVADLCNQYQTATDNLSKAKDGVAATEEAIKTENISLEDNSKKTQEATDATNEATAATEANTAANQANAESEEEIADNAQALIDGNLQVKATAEDVAKAQELLQDEYEATKQAAKDSLDNQIDMWKNADGKEAQSMQDLLNNLDRIYKAREEREKNLERVRKKCSKDTYEYVCGLSDEEVAIIAGANTKQLQSFSKKYEKIKKIDGDIADDMAKAGTEGGRRNIENAEKELNKTDGIKQKGKKAADAYKDGLAGNTNKVRQTTANIGAEAAKGFEQNTAQARSAGYAFSSGFVIGMAGNLARVRAAAAQQGAEALKALNNSINAHSPSREAKKSGVYLGQGFEVGMEERMSNVAKIASQLGKAATLSLQGSVNTQQKIPQQKTFELDYDLMAKSIVSEFKNTELQFNRRGMTKIIDSRIKEALA